MDATSLFSLFKNISPLLPLGGFFLYSFKRSLNKADKIDEEERAELLALHKEERDLFNQAAEKLGIIFPLLYSATAHEDTVLNVLRDKNYTHDEERKKNIKDAIGIAKNLRSSLVEIAAKNKAYSGNSEFSKKYRRIIVELEAIHRTLDQVVSPNNDTPHSKIYDDVCKAIYGLRNGYKDPKSHKKIEKWHFSRDTKFDKEHMAIKRVLVTHREVEIGANEIYDLCRLRLNCVLYRYKDLPDYLENMRRTQYESKMKEKYIGDKDSYIIKEKILDKFSKSEIDKIVCNFSIKGFLGNIFYLLYFKVYWLVFLLVSIYIPVFIYLYTSEPKIGYLPYLLFILLVSTFISFFGEYFIYKNYKKTKKYIEKKVIKYKERIEAMEYTGKIRWFNKPLPVLITIAITSLVLFFCSKYGKTIFYSQIF